MKPRSQEDFDTWFRHAKGDPWGYESEFIRHRLSASLEFIRKQLSSPGPDTFIEFGAFDGSFTVLLAAEYPKATVMANDISSVALAKLRVRTAHLPNVTVVPGDMTQLSPAAFPGAGNGNVVLLMLECLYYLPGNEQGVFLQKCRQEYGDFTLFLSAPMTGGNYYTEHSLERLLAAAGLGIFSRQVLNFSRPIPRMLRFRWLLNNSSYIRSRYANQVIHCIRPVQL